MSQQLPRHQVSDDVIRELTNGIVHEAVRAAQLLSCVWGETRPNKNAAKGKVSAPNQQKLVIVAAAMAAYLRRMEWRYCGLELKTVPSFPQPDDWECPPMEQALKDNDPEALHACKQYVVRTLLTWIVNFCWCARAELNTDVLLSGSPAMTDNQLGPLVEFLTKHHRNAKATGGD